MNIEQLKKYLELISLATKQLMIIINKDIDENQVEYHLKTLGEDMLEIMLIIFASIPDFISIDNLEIDIYEKIKNELKCRKSAKQITKTNL